MNLEATPDPRRYGPWAVIAGGSEGVGARFAHRLAEAGFDLVLIARTPGPLLQTANEVAEHGHQVRTITADLTDPAGLDQIVAETAGLEVGLLVFNAGANSYGHEFVSGDLDRFWGVIELNVRAQLRLVHHFGAKMRARRRGGIVLVGSMAGFSGKAQIGVYAAAKAFGRIFAEGLWLELREYGVDVLELVLGVTRTPAMVRAGLNLDLPTMTVSEPDDVARQGLANLGNGPVLVAEGHERTVELQNGPDRRRVLLGARAATQRLLPPPD